MKDQFNHNHYFDVKLMSLLEDKSSKEENTAIDKIKNTFNINHNQLNTLIDFNNFYIYLQNTNKNSKNTLHFKFDASFENKTIFFIFANPVDSFIYNLINIEVQTNVFIKVLHLQQINKLKNAININITSGTVDIDIFSDIAKNQLVDESIELIHAQGFTKSKINYHSFVSGKIATQVNTKILENSRQSESHQSIKHVSEQKGSIILSKPNLMIMNPDVVSSHGNSIGSIPHDYLIYLQQRGISKDKAINMIKKSEYSNVFMNDFNHEKFISLWESIYEN